MQSTTSVRRRSGHVLVAVGLALGGSVAAISMAPTASAATPGSEYVFTFVGQSAGDLDVTNTAAANVGVDMTLSPANWTPTANGIDFDGAPNTLDDGTDDSTSVGFANPPGSTPPTMVADGSFGISARFTYQRAAAGTCGTAGNGVVNEITSNIAQLGRAGTGKSQIKLQISECKNGALVAKPRVSCRAAGTNPSTASGQLVTNQLVDLVDGVTYVARCVKGPDNLAAVPPTAPITVLVQPVGGSPQVEDAYDIPATGQFNSDQYVSVGDKYAGPTYNDQFFGQVAKMAICQAAAAADVTACLDAEVPPSAATSTELVTNPSVETNLTGWAKSGSGTTLARIAVTPGAPGGGTKSLRVSTTVAGSSTNKVGFLASPRLDVNTMVGNVYTGSVWVKPGAVGQLIKLRVREMVGTTNSQTGTAQIATLTATTTDWTPLTVQKTATASGNSIHFEVYSENIPAGQVFYADLMSLVRQ
jgi:hypothetical protein